MIKLAATVSTVLLGLGLATLLPAQPPPNDGPPAFKVKGKGTAKAKKKGDREPGGDLRKAYDLLRRLRADESAAGRPEERLREWTDQAARLYRDGLRAQTAADMFRAREYGTAAHDLARAVDHARNASRYDRPDPDLPPPSDDFGLEDTRDRARRDLTRAYERIGWLGTWQAAPNAEVYIKAARDLYSAARRDLEAGRDERAGELARAAEAMTHVPEHLAQIGTERGREARPVSPPPDRPEPKAKRGEPLTAVAPFFHRSYLLVELDFVGEVSRERRLTIFPGDFIAEEVMRIMDWRNRTGLYGSYFLGMAAIGFTLPYLPLYLGEKGLSDRAIGIVSTLAALSALAQFPVGLWSDRIGWRKPFLVVALATAALATALLPWAHGVVWLGFLVILFAENGITRAVVESLSGAEAAALARPGAVGAALGALRFWKPIGIIIVALLGSWMSERYGVGAILLPLAVVQGLAVAAALLIDEKTERHPGVRDDLAKRDWLTKSRSDAGESASGWFPRNAGLWAFVAAMILYHAANAPGGVYLGLFLKRDLQAPDRMLAYAFAVSMGAWMLVVWPAGWLADRCGRKPLLIAGWMIMAVRLGLVSVVGSPMLAVANQALDGLANGLFAVLAAAWVTDRLADPRRAGEAQVIVGSCLVFGSAIGPAVAGFLVGPLGYRGLFALLAGVGALATAIVVFFVPETLAKREELVDDRMVDAIATTPDRSVVSKLT